MRFVADVVHNVRNLEQVLDLLVQGLDFQVESQRDQTCVLNNGAITIRLTCDNSLDQGVLHLSMETNDLAESCDYLTGLQFTALAEEHWVSVYRKELPMQGPHGIHITLARNYNEDELGIVPDLPMSLEWREEAESIIKKLLALVPISFRDSARCKITQKAEADTIVEGETIVGLDSAMKAIVYCTPAFRMQELRENMDKLGIDTSLYFTDTDGTDA